MFCRFCGNQVRDEAYVCPSCGRQLKELPTELSIPQVCVEQAPAPRDKSKVKKLCRIFGTLGITFNAIGFGFTLLFLLGWAILPFIGLTQSEYYAPMEKGLVVSIMLILYGLIFGLVFGSFGADFSTAAFVLGLIQKEDKALKRRATGAFIGGLIIVTLLVMAFFSVFIWLSIAGAGV